MRVRAHRRDLGDDSGDVGGALGLRLEVVPAVEHVEDVVELDDVVGAERRACVGLPAPPDSRSWPVGTRLCSSGGAMPRVPAALARPERGRHLAHGGECVVHRRQPQARGRAARRACAAAARAVLATFGEAGSAVRVSQHSRSKVI